MDLKRNEQCFVCGKDGTAKESASRIAQLPTQSLHHSRKIIEKRIRESLKISEGKLTILLETVHGTKTLEGKALGDATPGDYLRVLVETRNGEFHESILKLT